MIEPLVEKVTLCSGVAGQISVTAEVTYPGEEPSTIGFFSSVYGGPVVMAFGETQTYVTDPGRFGEFGTDWVRRFFSEAGR